jgi:hypothetical protein
VDFLKDCVQSAQTPQVKERQHKVRRLVKEIPVDPDSLRIRHSIPIAPGEKPPPNRPDSNPSRQPGYLLRPQGQHAGDNISEFWVPRGSTPISDLRTSHHT